MKSNLVLLLTLFSVLSGLAQTTIIPHENDSRVIVTGMPFLLIAPDARAAGMGDMGVATTADAFSQQWNAAKYTFTEAKSGVGVSYTPYLSRLVKDIFLGDITYFNRLDNRSAVAASIKYFSLGDIEFTTDEFSESLLQRPNEFSIDASYGLRLTPDFALAVAMRYMRSDLKIQGIDSDASAASTVGVDITGFYQGEEKAFESFTGRWRAGFAIQNLGPKFKYDQGGQSNFQPTILRLGTGYDFNIDPLNRITISTEFTKLLVPTPPIYGDEYNYTDTNNNGKYDEGTDQLGTRVKNNVIYKGSSPDVNFLSGIFKSFGDAPGGFKEELKEFTWALGAEYAFQNAFSMRTGYFHESEEKGARKFFAIGAGFKAKVVHIDLSYLFSTSQVQSPLENTLRFGLTFNFGEGSYSEL